MEMLYKSTRGDHRLVTPSQGIIKGIAEDGGLYIPVYIPKVKESLEELASLNYKQLALYILKKYLTDFTEEELYQCINEAYDNKFQEGEVVSINKVGKDSFLELYHGPTLAFKDMALSILPHLLNKALKKNNISEDVVILTATSGDTGTAALEAFSGAKGIKIIVFYPHNGVSEIQKHQMVTQQGENVLVVGLKGNFDDAQNGVKAIFNDKEYKEILKESGYILSSANSINIGRLIPQIVYYFYGYLQLLRNKEIKDGEKINVVVPTGNFGNILAAYYAKAMGLPIDKLICASNENNVLYDFINTGIYDLNRDFKITNSPSMDILISSNLERLIYYLSEENTEIVSGLMKDLRLEGKYEINELMKNNLKDFYSGFSTDSETLNTIKEIYESHGYVMDTHTAVAYSVYKKCLEQVQHKEKAMIISTASPFKFTRNVCEAVGIETDRKDDFQLINELSNILKIPISIRDLEKKEVVHRLICETNEIKNMINKFLQVGERNDN